MKQFFLFTQKGITERFYCGNIYEGLPTDEIRYNGCPFTFEFCAEQNLCKVFANRKDANNCSLTETNAMYDSNQYAQDAMRFEETEY